MTVEEMWNKIVALPVKGKIRCVGVRRDRSGFVDCPGPIAMRQTENMISVVCRSCGFKTRFVANQKLTRKFKQFFKANQVSERQILELTRRAASPQGKPTGAQPVLSSAPVIINCAAEATCLPPVPKRAFPLGRKRQRRAPEHRRGYVYLISNSAYGGWVKIGQTIDMRARLSTYQTGDPFKRYSVEVAILVPDRRRMEVDVLRDLSTRFARKGEWVNCAIEDAAVALDRCLNIAELRATAV
jgi:hypothetical protein